MSKFTPITLSLAMLGVLSLGALSACANSNSDSNSSNPSTTQSKSNQAMHANTPFALDLSAIGLAKQLTVSNDKLLIINDKNELWQWGESSALARNVSDKITPVAGFDKLAFADTEGYFHLIQNGKTYPSSIRLSSHSGMLILPLAVIAVVDDNGTPSLVRLEVVGDSVQVVAKFAPVLPDARPVQINFASDNTNGHIAILSHPDSTTYRHGVLGDGIEAGQLQFLERHSLTPLAKPLMVDGQVFEANTVAILPHDRGNHLVATMAGGGNGARTVVIDNVDGTLQIIAQSEPLPSNRWQSPFVFDGKLYAVQMPHLVGKLVQYQRTHNALTEQVLGEPYSNHKIGDFETNVAATTEEATVIPTMDYLAVGVLDRQGQITQLNTKLPSPIKKLVATRQEVYALLGSGAVWRVR